MKDHTDAILNTIRNHHAEHGYSPTLAEIADGAGLSETWAHELLKRLIDKGLVERYQFCRGWRVASDELTPESPASRTGQHDQSLPPDKCHAPTNQ